LFKQKRLGKKRARRENHPSTVGEDGKIKGTLPKTPKKKEIKKGRGKGGWPGLFSSRGKSFSSSMKVRNFQKRTVECKRQPSSRRRKREGIANHKRRRIADRQIKVKERTRGGKGRDG